MDREEEQYLSDARAEVLARSVRAFDMLARLMADACESPIERRLAITLVKSSRCVHAFADMVFAPAMRPDLRNWPAKPRSIGTAVCFPQARIGKYRVDFLLARRIAVGDTQDAWRRLVVECDGHDYHERTKEQAARDKGRDRFLAARGYPVVRFTGSEIYNDPNRCIQDLASVWHGVPTEDQ